MKVVKLHTENYIEKKYSIINNKKSLKSRAKESAEKAEKLTLEYLLSPTSIQSRQMHSV